MIFGYKAIKVNGCKIMILPEGAVQVVKLAFVRKKNFEKPAAFFGLAGKEKIAESYDAGYKAKQPGTENICQHNKAAVKESSHFFPLPTAENVRRRKIPLKIRLMINRLKVSEFRIKSLKGRKWEIRSAPF